MNFKLHYYNARFDGRIEFEQGEKMAGDKEDQADQPAAAAAAAAIACPPPPHHNDPPKMFGMHSRAPSFAFDFKGTVACAMFEADSPIIFLCRNCKQKMEAHKREAVGSESEVERVTAFIEALHTVPNEILPAEGGVGGLWLGAYRSALNRKFLVAHDIKAVVSVGLTMSIFGAVFPAAMERLQQDLQLDHHLMPLLDTPIQVISKQDLQTTLMFIHKHRLQGKGVLVHCSQGKSRSSMVVCAYLAATRFRGDTDQALAYVKARRVIAQPNKGFLGQLRKMGGEDGVLVQWSEQLGS